MELESGKRVDHMSLLSFVMIVLGIKLLIISGFGSPVPYWDQWDAEADRLYRPFIEGSLRLNDLLAPHNEHRIFTTRLLGLALLLLNKGVWDPMLEMYVNALIHVGALLLLVFLMQKGLAERHKPLLSGFATLLFAVPLGYDNILAGFQSQFYLLMFFGFLLLWMTHRFESNPLKWIGMIIPTVFLCYFSMASGALSIAAAAGLLLTRWLTGAERKGTSLLLAVLLLASFIAAVFFTPVVPAHSLLKASDPQEFLLAVLVATGGGLLYIPLIIFMVRQLFVRPVAQHHTWFIFSLGLWIFGQILAIAYGRGHDILSSRYLDLLAVGIILNASSVLVLMQEGFRHDRVHKATIIWGFLVLIFLGAFMPKMLRKIDDKKTHTQSYEENIYGYLMSSNSDFLQKVPYEEIPYPDAERLQSLLDNNTVAGILTPVINGHNTNRGLQLYTVRSRKNISVIAGIMIYFGFSLLFYTSILQTGKGYETES